MCVSVSMYESVYEIERVNVCVSLSYIQDRTCRPDLTCTHPPRFHTIICTMRHTLTHVRMCVDEIAWELTAVCRCVVLRIPFHVIFHCPAYSFNFLSYPSLIKPYFIFPYFH